MSMRRSAAGGTCAGFVPTPSPTRCSSASWKPPTMRARSGSCSRGTSSSLRSLEVRRKIFEVFDRENARAADNYSGDRRSLYDSLKLQGILDAPLNLAVTCDREPWRATRAGAEHDRRHRHV